MTLHFQFWATLLSGIEGLRYFAEHEGWEDVALSLTQSYEVAIRNFKEELATEAESKE